MKTVWLHLSNILTNYLSLIWQLQIIHRFIKYYTKIHNSFVLKLINFIFTFSYLLLKSTELIKKPLSTFYHCYLLILLKRFNFLFQIFKNKILITTFVISKNFCVLKTVWCCVLLCWLGSGSMADLNYIKR